MASRDGVRREMEPFDALMYRSEDDPRARSDMMAVFVLDGAPDWARLVATFERATRELPTLRQKVVQTPLPVLLPQWVVDPDFDLSYHLRRTVLPAGSDWRAFLDTLEPMMMAPLDRARPLWEFTLIEGLENGRAAFVTKMNHAVTDGLGGLAYVETIFDWQADAPVRPMPPKPAPLDVTPRDLVRQAIRRAPVAAVRGSARSVRRGAERSRNLLTHPRQVTGSANAFVQSFRRVLLGPAIEPSPLMRRRSLRRRLLTLEVGLPELKSAAKSAGGSVNDGLLAAVAGGLRLYHEKLGVPVDSVGVAIPISLRTADDPAGGNRWAGARLTLPVGQADAVTRIQLIREMVLEARDEPAANALSMVAPVVARIPSSWLAYAVGGSVPVPDLQVSNVPGSPEPFYLAGAKVEKLIPFGPLPGPAAMITMNSYVTTGHIGINLDPAAITEPETFLECLHQGVAEVLALGGAPARRTTRRGGGKAAAATSEGHTDGE